MLEPFLDGWSEPLKSMKSLEVRVKYGPLRISYVVTESVCVGSEL